MATLVSWKLTTKVIRGTCNRFDWLQKLAITKAQVRLPDIDVALWSVAGKFIASGDSLACAASSLAGCQSHSLHEKFFQ